MNNKGRLVVEFALAVGCCSFLLAGAVALLRSAREQQVLYQAARLGTMLQSRRGVSEDTARQEVLQMLNEENVRDALLITGRYLDSASARFYKMVRTRIEKGPLTADVICEQEEQ